jgi:hypothetical protein
MGSRVWICAVLAAAACAPNYGGGARVGRAFEEARSRQIENPGAGETLVPIEGVGPGTAEGILANYHRNQDTDVQDQTQQRQRQDGLTGTSGGN